MHEFISASKPFIAIVPDIKAFLTVTLTQKPMNFQKEFQRRVIKLA